MKKRRFLRNYKLKAMALVLAMLSWVIVKQITNNDKVIPEVPVRLTLPEGWAVRDKDINTVQVTFSGTREDLASLDQKTVQVNIDLRTETFEPKKGITILPRMVSFAGSNTRITAIEPQTLNLQLGKEGQKQLPVLVSQTGQPPEGFKVEAIVLEPNLAVLVGAEDLLEGLNALQTAPLNLSEKIQSFEQRLDILLPNPEWVGRVEPSRVLVKVTLAGLTVERKFSDIPLFLTHPAGQQAPLRQVVTPSGVDVFLRGPPQLLDQLDLRLIQAFVSAENLESRESNTRKVNVLVPAGIEVLGIQPDLVEIRTLPPPTPPPMPTPVPPTPTPVPPTPTPVPPPPTATPVPKPTASPTPVPEIEPEMPPS
jgi:YbbR domain-containing protein